MKKLRKKAAAIIIIILMTAGAAGYFYYSTYHTHRHGNNEELKYTCPMHPQIITDRPGNCPICGMKLVPLKKEEDEATKPKKKILYRSTMNPGEISSKPGKDSMGMAMLPFEVDEEKPGSIPSGMSAISLSPSSRELLGITIGTASYRNIHKEIRASAKIIPDERRMYRMTPKVSGWIENLYVNQTGQFVRKGDPLFTLYSPELLAAEQEYISALDAEKKSKNIADEMMTRNITEVKSAARERLRLLDLTEKQIEALEKSGKYERTVTLYSPVTGYVTEKAVLPGQKIMMNEASMIISDLSVVWGEAEIFETDLPYIRPGMTVEITLSFWPGKVFKGTVSFIYPSITEETRTLKVRMNIENPGLLLKIGMYADARLYYGPGKRLTVPESAVMRTGIRDYVFIEGRDYKIIPREVRLGMKSSDGYYEITSGLKSGERVVTSANFLIDSESSLKAAFKSAEEKRVIEKGAGDHKN